MYQRGRWGRETKWCLVDSLNVRGPAPRCVLPPAPLFIAGEGLADEAAADSFCCFC